MPHCIYHMLALQKYKSMLCTKCILHVCYHHSTHIIINDFAPKIFVLLVFRSPKFLINLFFLFFFWNTTAKFSFLFSLRNHFDVLTSYERGFQCRSLKWMLYFSVQDPAWVAACVWSQRKEWLKLSEWRE